MDAYIVVHYSFLGKDNKVLYLSKVIDILHAMNVSKNVWDRLCEIRVQLAKKNTTKMGKDRKKRIVEKLFYKYRTSFLYLSFYKKVLPILKSYVMTFQTQEHVMVHELHEPQLDTFRRFLACFVKAGYIGKTGKQVKEMNFKSDEGQFLDLKDMFVGGEI